MYRDTRSTVVEVPEGLHTIRRRPRPDRRKLRRKLETKTENFYKSGSSEEESRSPGDGTGSFSLQVLSTGSDLFPLSLTKRGPVENVELTPTSTVTYYVNLVGMFPVCEVEERKFPSFCFGVGPCTLLVKPGPREGRR